MLKQYYITGPNKLISSGEKKKPFDNDYKNITNSQNILLQLYGPLLGVDDEAPELERAEEDDVPTSTNSVIYFSAYRTRLLCSKSLLRSTDVS